MLVGVAAATAIVSAARGHFASGADAVSLAITLVVAAAVGGSAAAEAGLGDPLAWSIVCLAAGAALAWAVCRHASGPTLVSGRNAVEAAPASFTGMVLAGGRLRTALTRLAMVTSLAGMVAWFFLAPEHARRYGLLAAAWFSCLAVPRGLLDPGGGADAWGRLARTAAVTAAGMTAAQRLRRPDLLGWANAAAVAHAAILGWPAVVAAALWLAGTGGGVPWPVITLAGLAGAAALLVALAALVESDSISRDTGHALASVAVIAILAGWLLLPGLRGVPKAPGQTDVEKIAPLER
jgi:hypothetical protein